ncbi:MAG: zinc ABC transporter substrate-binding protein [Rhabdochlamydiaceae bacterium]|nr:zinc ABC transporter substrate-binding protein [Candidatus Amphrikana amoebophyrae]
MKILSLLLLPIILLFGCSSSNDANKNVILVSAPPYVEIVQELVGDLATVKSILADNQNIHFFEPRPKEMAKFANAAIWFGVGESFEKKILPSLKQKGKITYINLSKQIPLIHSSSNHCHGHGHHHEHLFDLHIWMSPQLMMKQVEVMKTALINWQPDKIGEIEANAQQVMFKLQKLNAEILQRLAPYKGNVILVGHPSLGYFCNTYDLIQYSIECDGKTPSPRDIEHLLRKLKHNEIRCAFAQPQFDERALKKIANDMTIPIYMVDPNSKHYYQTVLQVADDITQ